MNQIINIILITCIFINTVNEYNENCFIIFINLNHLNLSLKNIKIFDNNIVLLCNLQII